MLKLHFMLARLLGFLLGSSYIEVTVVQFAEVKLVLTHKHFRRSW